MKHGVYKSEVSAKAIKDDLVLPSLLSLLEQRRMDEFEDNSKVAIL